jgi:drug/metabolite transporter (DMT)-like permease
MLPFRMQKLVYVLCVALSLLFILPLWMFNGSEEFPFLMVLLLGFLVVLLINWFFNIRKPISEILRLTWRSLLVTLAANVGIYFLLLFLFYLTLQAGWWNR